MAADERAKQQDRVSSNVRPFVPPTAPSASKTERASGRLARDCNVIHNDDDPGPSAA
jgi:hypothetical protein